jgi:HTH-type transcriptional regulator / antitoxin HipB
MFPIGNISPVTKKVVTSSTELGSIVRQRRMNKGLRQEDLALASGTGRRFVIELEQGKANIRLDSTLKVLQALGLELTVAPRDGYA